MLNAIVCRISRREASEIVSLWAEILERRREQEFLLDVGSRNAPSWSQNTPLEGWQFTGKVVATIVGGKVVYRGGRAFCGEGLVQELAGIRLA